MELCALEFATEIPLFRRRFSVSIVIAMDTSSTPPESEQPQPPVQPVVPDPARAEANARAWAMWCHLSSLAGFVVPFGNVVGPLIIWQVKKAEFPVVDEHGRESLNFQLSLLIYLFAGGIAAFALSFVCIGILLIPLLGAAWLAGVILSIIAGIKANEGGHYQYPLNLRLVK
jgi:uncharacterized protein